MSTAKGKTVIQTDEEWLLFLAQYSDVEKREHFPFCKPANPFPQIREWLKGRFPLWGKFNHAFPRPLPADVGGRNNPPHLLEFLKQVRRVTPRVRLFRTVHFGVSYRVLIFSWR